MEIDNAWLQLLNSQKEKAYEHLESIYQDMYKNILNNIYYNEPVDEIENRRTR